MAVPLMIWFAWTDTDNHACNAETSIPATTAASRRPSRERNQTKPRRGTRRIPSLNRTAHAAATRIPAIAPQRAGRRCAVARRRARAIMAGPQRNMLEVDCIIWSAALTTLAFIS